MKVQILKRGGYIIAFLPSSPSGEDLMQLRHALCVHIERNQCKGVILDVAGLDVMDAFSTRAVRELAQIARLRGAETIVTGIQPEVALGMVQLGLELGDVPTALDLDEGIADLQHLATPAK